MNKLEIALRIIAGVDDPCAHWDLFMGKRERPTKYKSADRSYQEQRAETALVVKETICSWLASYDRQKRMSAIQRVGGMP